MNYLIAALAVSMPLAAVALVAFQAGAKYARNRSVLTWEPNPWRDALIEVHKLDEVISDDRDLIRIDKHEVRGWVAWHAEYPEEGSIRLSDGDDEECGEPGCALVKGHPEGHWPFPRRAEGSPEHTPNPTKE